MKQPIENRGDAIERYLDRITVDYYGHNALCACKRRRLIVEPSPHSPEVVVLRRVRLSPLESR